MRVIRPLAPALLRMVSSLLSRSRSRCLSRSCLRPWIAPAGFCANRLRKVNDYNGLFVELELMFDEVMEEMFGPDPALHDERRTGFKL